MRDTSYAAPIAVSPVVYPSRRSLELRTRPVLEQRIFEQRVPEQRGSDQREPDPRTSGTPNSSRRLEKRGRLRSLLSFGRRAERDAALVSGNADRADHHGWTSVRDRGAEVQETFARSDDPTLRVHGQITDGTIARLLAGLTRSQRSGTLTVVSNSDHISLVVAGKHLLYASDSRPEHRLGALLLDHGLIESAHLDRALLEQKTLRAGQALGLHLLVRGALNERELRWCLHRQSAAALSRLQTLRDGYFAFDSTARADLKRLHFDELMTLERIQARPGR